MDGTDSRREESRMEEKQPEKWSRKPVPEVYSQPLLCDQLILFSELAIVRRLVHFVLFFSTIRLLPHTCSSPR